MAWVVIKWAKACKPRIIHLENVVEFQDWGKLNRAGSPSKEHKGKTFKRWVKQLENLGYVVEYREIVAADFDTPTIRKRLYLIARCDGAPIVWPEATHSKAGAAAQRWRPAHECIDFSIPAKSIFGRKKE
ncbi:DNA cytosine methyltransferase, partial [Delftia sp. ASV31]|uniref:DNA cytosine methyltransferase n=1 Tax=Delftia sp. ASV31 TaxID=2795113 RepID=UPI001E2AFDC5